MLPDKLKQQIEQCEGADCECHAYYDGECGCSADWRSADEVVMDWLRTHPATREEVLIGYLEGEQ